MIRTFAEGYDTEDCFRHLAVTLVLSMMSMSRVSGCETTMLDLMDSQWNIILRYLLTGTSIARGFHYQDERYDLLVFAATMFISSLAEIQHSSPFLGDVVPVSPSVQS